MVTGFAPSGRLTTTTGFTRPKRVHAFALRLTSSPSRSSTTWLPASPPSQLHGARAITMVSTFQLTRSARLSLADQKRTKTNEGESRELSGRWTRHRIVRIFSSRDRIGKGQRPALSLGRPDRSCRPSAVVTEPHQGSDVGARLYAPLFGEPARTVRGRFKQHRLIGRPSGLVRFAEVLSRRRR